MAEREIVSSPGDAHETTELKGKIRATSRGEFVNISMASVGISMVGDGERWHARQDRTLDVRLQPGAKDEARCRVRTSDRGGLSESDR
jgi:hypothetical protein